MNLFAHKRNLWLLAAMIVGSLLLAGGYHLITWKSGQADNYNAGIRAYQNGDMPTAIQFFDKSIDSYKREKRASWVHRFFYPQPSEELAAMANFQKAKAHLQNRQGELAVEAFKESLRLNPGDRYE